jgi:hypothetical protein
MDQKKVLPLILLFTGLSTAGFSSVNQDSLGLPGDNLDLAGTLELFRTSKNLEEFEKSLNDSKSEVNNLDLNGDQEVDYIRVIDHVEGNAHAIVLQVPVSDTESQDVAVIEIEKKDNENASLQIVGDEDIYGKDYIVEPLESGKTGATDNVRAGLRPPVVVNVIAWPVVKFIYAPGYVVYASPWKWRAYPKWWKPWSPVAWHVHHKRVARYHAFHHRVGHHRLVHVHKIYKPHRVVAVSMHHHHKKHPGHHGKHGHHKKHGGPNKHHGPKGGKKGK